MMVLQPYQQEGVVTIPITLVQIVENGGGNLIDTSISGVRRSPLRLTQVERMHHQIYSMLHFTQIIQLSHRVRKDPGG